MSAITSSGFKDCQVGEIKMEANNSTQRYIKKYIHTDIHIHYIIYVTQSDKRCLLL